MKNKVLILIIFSSISFKAFGQKVLKRHEATALSGAIWSNKKISVCWQDSGFEKEKEIVKQAVEKTWDKESAIDFNCWCDCKEKAADIRIKIKDETPHVKELGRYLKNKSNGMVLNFTFNNWCPACKVNKDFSIKAIAVHEFGHALGFSHEQNRPDTPPTCAQEKQGTKGDWIIGSWDGFSVMNYCNPKWNNYGELSNGDITAVQAIYGYDDIDIKLDDGILVTDNKTKSLTYIDKNGAYTGLGKADWQKTTSMAWFKDRLFIIQNKRLHEFNFKNNSYSVLGKPNWGGKTSMVAVGNFLYVVQNGTLHKISPKTLKYYVLGKVGNWKGTTSMATLNNKLYIIQNKRLHLVNMRTGKWKVIGKPAWNGWTSMTGHGSFLYIIQNNRLHRVNPKNGKWKVMGGANWGGEAIMTTLKDQLIIIQNKRIHSVTPTDDKGQWREIGVPIWGEATAITTKN